jgi:hypothetical protein
MKTFKMVVNIVCFHGGLMFTGCRDSRPDFESVSDYCGEFSWSNPPVYRGVGATIECVEVLADAVNFQHDSFEYTLAPIEEAQSTPEVVIGGLYSLFMTDLVSVDYVLEDDGAPDLLVSMIEKYLEEGLVNQNTSIGEFYFQISVNKLTKIEATYSEEEDFFMMQRFNTIQVNHLINSEIERQMLNVSTITSSVFLAHELAHVDTRSPHIECPNGEFECDVNHNGAYGISIYQTKLWFDIVSEQYRPDLLCSEYYVTMLKLCPNIINKNEDCRNLDEFYESFCGQPSSDGDETR